MERQPTGIRHPSRHGYRKYLSAIRTRGRRERVRLDDPPDHGFGMVIVAKLAEGWGSSSTTTGGKTVWAVLRTADPGPGTRGSVRPGH